MAAASIYKGSLLRFYLSMSSDSLCRLTRPRGRIDSSNLPDYAHGLSPPLFLLNGFSPSASQIGWKPSPNQQKPAKRGSGTVNLADALGLDGKGNKPLE